MEADMTAARRRVARAMIQYEGWNNPCGRLCAWRSATNERRLKSQNILPDQPCYSTADHYCLSRVPAGRMWKQMHHRFWQRLTYGLLLCLLFLIAFTFLDYGLTWDEEIQKTYGEHVLNWYASFFQDRQALAFANLYFYGAFFEMLAQLATRISPFGVYETRHLASALFGLLGIFIAYKFGSYLYNPMGGFFSALFLTLTPVFYGHSFNNPKDIPFATLFLLALYYIIRSYDSLPNMTKLHLVKTGIAIGLAMGVRIVGILLLGYLIVLCAAWLIFRQLLNRAFSQSRMALHVARLIGLLMAVTLVAWIVMLACWPWAQVSPLFNPLGALQVSAHFAWSAPVFFNGREIAATNLPRTYLPVWLAISLPEFYFIALVIGCLPAYRFISNPEITPQQSGQISKIGLLVFAVCLPLFAAITLRPTVYDGLRHFMFILPPLAILAGISFAGFLRSILHPLLKYGIAVLVVLCAAITAADMIQLHPYQSVYFNRIIAGGLPSAAKRFETDYWGSSYREGALWVIQNYHAANAERVRVANCSAPFLTEYFFEQSPNARQRFINVTPDKNPHLFLATTRNNCHEKITGRILHIVERQGTPLLYVFETHAPSLIAGDGATGLTLAESILPDAAFNADISLPDKMIKFSAGQPEIIQARIKNTSDSVWPSLARSNGKYKVQLGNHWLDENNKIIVTDDGRSDFPFDIKPGDEATLKLTVTPPKIPGNYLLELDLVQEQVMWFAQKGSRTYRLKVQVE